MSTHSGIGIQDADGSVRGIYCHFDGNHVGRTLVEHHNTRSAAEAIIALGSLRSLSASLEYTPQKEVFADHGTEAYGRDYGEAWTDVQPRVFADIAAWRREGYECMYLWMAAGVGEHAGPEGWYTSVPGGWSPLVGVRVA